MNEEYSYIFYTFFKNLQEMKEKPPWCLFDIYHMYAYVREVTETDFYNSICLYFQFDSISVFSEWFE